MDDRRVPPPRPIDYDSAYAPPPGYDRRAFAPPDDYRQDRYPLPPHAMRSPPGYDPRDGPLPPSRRRDGYDDYSNPPPLSAEARGKRRRSISPRRGESDPYLSRDPYRPGPPHQGAKYAEYPPPRPHSPPGYRGPPSSAYYSRGAPLPSRQIPEAPHHLSYVVTHRYFKDWFEATNPASLAESADALELAWKKYLAENMRKSLRPTFDELRAMKWFEEKYAVGDEWDRERESRSAEGTNGRVAAWCEAADKGEWQNVTSEFDEEALSSSPATKSAATPADANGDATMSESSKKKPEAALGDGLVPRTPESVLVPSRPNRVLIETIPSSVAFSELHALFAPFDGFVRLSTGDGDATADWTRTGWATFDTEENATKAIETLSEAMIREYKLALSKQDQPREIKIRAAPSAMSAPDRMKVDLANVEGIIELAERGQAGEGKTGSQVIRDMRESWEKDVEAKKGRGEDVVKDEAEVVRKTLDLSLHYLRFAFHTCYYCTTRCSSPETLEAVCPRHVRRVGPALPADVPFVKAFDEKVPLLGDLEKLDLRDFGAELKEETLFSLCSPYIKNEEEGKFRCKECNKLFSARKFVEKHIVTKHGQFVNDALIQVQYFNNYILDPAHHPRSEYQVMNFLPSLAAAASPAPALADRIGGRRTNGSTPDKRQKRDGPPPPPPKGAVLDPRAARVPSSYADLDGTPGGAPDVVELPY
ncbi:hypothetical protein JCM11491_005535 [Sporobolomyces phaffii]